MAGHWNHIAAGIAHHYQDYDGFVVLHGTDTMAYTASALSFMLEGLAKPVILTGSQIPLSQTLNDARSNLLQAILIAAHYLISEVCIYFNHQLFRGNRTHKVSTEQFSAFATPNYPELGRVGVSVQIHVEQLLQPPGAAFRLQKINKVTIANFRLFPGVSSKVLNNILQKPLQGLVLETYGSGDGPSNDKALLKTLAHANDRGVIIVNCTQCQQGCVNMSAYATGRVLQQAGLISGYDMTSEAAHCKLLYLLSKNLSVSEIKQQMQMNLRGELSPVIKPS